MYFISWKTIPQALSTVGKNISKIIRPLHGKYSSQPQLPPARNEHWFSSCHALLSLASHFSSIFPSLHLLPSDPHWKLQQCLAGPLWGDIFSKGAEEPVDIQPNKNYHTTHCKTSWCLWWVRGPVAMRIHCHSSLMPEVLPSGWHDHTIGKLLVWPFRDSESSPNLANISVWCWASHIAALTIRISIHKMTILDKSSPNW